jgi:hypothetical protein
MNIPAIGAFKLVQTPASLNVADKLINAPGYKIEHNDGWTVLDHQISYLAASLHCDKISARQELDEFANKLKSYLLKGPFQWNGLGTLELSEDKVKFYPSRQVIQLLQPVPADRVIRDRSLQNVLVSNREEIVTQDEIDESPRKRRKTAIIIGWILIIISLAFIAFHFYKNGLKPSSSGNQMKIKIEQSK